MAYTIATTSVIALVTAYSVAILHRAQHAALVGAGVAALYGYLYVLLTNEDYALLMGRSRGTRKLILLTDLLTADLDNPGYSWDQATVPASASRPIQPVWTGLDSRNLATDQITVPAASDRVVISGASRSFADMLCRDSPGTSLLKQVTPRSLQARGHEFESR